MFDADSVEVLAVAGLLNKHLAVHVVVVTSSEDMNVPHHLQNIQSLLNSLWWEVVLNNLQSKAGPSRMPLYSISSPVVKRNCSLVVESFLPISFHSLLDRNQTNFQERQYLEKSYGISPGLL